MTTKALQAKAGAATNFSDRPVKKRGTRHNRALETKIEKAHGGGGKGPTRRGGVRQAKQGNARHGMEKLDEVGQARFGLGPHGMARGDKAGMASPGSVRQRLGGPEDLARDEVAWQDEGRPAAKEKNGSVKSTSKTEVVKITEPNFQVAEITIRGLSPYVQHAFSQKARIKMEETQRAGSRSRSKKTREARDFEADYLAAMHKSTEGWCGMPASGFRNALISACKIVGFFQTRAKLAIFVQADGIDAVDGTPLVKIVGEPQIHQGYARNESGVADLRWRPMWQEWSATVRLEWDADMLSAIDIINLMMRAGRQVGIGEGRPDSPNSNGLGWGTWEVVS